MKDIIFFSLFWISIAAMTSCSTRTAEQKVKRQADTTISPNMENMVMLTPRDEQHANIQIDTVKIKSISEYTTLSGTTSIDERNVNVVTARIRGRIDKLFVRTSLVQVSKGQPLYAMYSEELLSYENELLNALAQQPHFNSTKQLIDQMVEAARKKLLLYGLDSAQLLQLEKDRLPSALITFHSPVNGTLTDLSVSEGQYVETGTLLYRISDLSQLWIEAQMYTNETKWLHEHPAVTVTFEEYPDEEYQATPVFDNPAIEPGKKISLVRFQVNNRKSGLKPGMMVYVKIRRNEKRTLVIPKSSILLGTMVTAWIKTDNGMFETRSIQLGIQNKKEVEVLSGLNEGELVVTSGAYLLNSALILRKGAGAHEMPGMNM